MKRLLLMMAWLVAAAACEAPCDHDTVAQGGAPPATYVVCSVLPGGAEMGEQAACDGFGRAWWCEGESEEPMPGCLESPSGTANYWCCPE